jgi:23S rRNA (guanosine2251-2'-O)-methyltransferase
MEFYFSSSLMKIAILDNLRSVHNVGSIFRTANAAGIEKLILCGTTPTPLDAKGNKRKDFAKVALGAEDTVAWEYEEDTIKALKKLRQEDCYVIAFEQDDVSVDYKEVNVTEKENIAFVIGPEVTGITKEVLDLCDVIAEIPMLGSKESLNVTIAFGIGVYCILGI